MHTPEGMGAGGRREGVWAGPCTCLRSGIRWGQGVFKRGPMRKPSH